MTSSVELVNRLKSAALAADLNRLDEFGDQFNEYCDRVQEVCRLLHHTATTDTLQVSIQGSPCCTLVVTLVVTLVTMLTTLSHCCVYGCCTPTLQVTSKHTEQSLEVYGQQLLAASQTLARFVGVPHWRMVINNSERRISKTRSTPSCPNAPRPQR